MMKNTIWFHFCFHFEDILKTSSEKFARLRLTYTRLELEYLIKFFSKLVIA